MGKESTEELMLFNCGVEKALESPLDGKEIKPVNPKGNQSWILTGRTHAEAEALILWPSYAKNCLIGNDPDAGKDWRQEERGTTEDVMIGWHHWLQGHVLEQALGVGDGQGSLACCIPWGCKESDTTERLHDNTSLNTIILFVVWLLWLWFPILCWRKVVRMGMLVFFQILAGRLSASHH